MNRLFSKQSQLAMGVALLASMLPACTGCGLMVNLIHAGWGHMVPPEFEGLAGHRVAVVCVSNTASYGPRPVAEMVARQVSQLLAKNVRDIEMIDQQTIEQWSDENDWNQVNYLEIGNGVGAEKLVAIDLVSFRLHEGQTMYKGRAEVEIKVYDLGDSSVAFQRSLPEIKFPHNAGQHTTDISEKDFRNRFVEVVAHRISRHFYPYDFKDDFARDPTLVGN
jgi:hypothetical protein